MSDESTQEQINKLQTQAIGLERDVSRATELAYANQKTLQALHGRVDDIEEDVADVRSNMLTVSQMDSLLDEKFNRQVVTGLKYALGVVVTAFLIKWVEFTEWLK